MWTEAEDILRILRCQILPGTIAKNGQRSVEHNLEVGQALKNVDFDGAVIRCADIFLSNDVC